MTPPRNDSGGIERICKQCKYKTMNRQIKFRGRRIDNGEWVCGFYFMTPLTDENSGALPESGWFFLSGQTRHCISVGGVVYVVDPATVGQFTGPLDKNGKEVYEGDIIEYENGNAGYGRPREQEISRDIIPPIIDHDEYADMMVWWKMGEVIGNVHENKELLIPPQ